MRFTTTTPISLALAALASATPQNTTSATPLNAVPSSWDGSCFYPKPDIGFELESYLGKWFQVAGTVAPFTAGCKCIQAQYELNVRNNHPTQTIKPQSHLFVVDNITD
jgi:apolipoprotein D and lipocalin family protein